MDQRQELRDFLVSRRARLTPEEVGLPHGGGRRRVTGLRRSEVAVLANLSVEYLTKLERGNAVGVSDSVLESVAGALQLDAAETTHLFELARGARGAAGSPRRPAQQRVRPGVQQLLDAMVGFPAFVQNGRLEVLAANALARAVYADMFDQAAQDGPGERLPSHARFTFLDDRSRQLYPEWHHGAADAVALLRAETSRSPRDRRLNEVIGELSSRSSEFSALWAAHDVRWHTSGVKQFRHRTVGDFALSFEGLQLPGDDGQTLVTFTPEPGSGSAQALLLLASWEAAPTPRPAASSAATPVATAVEGQREHE